MRPEEERPDLTPFLIHLTRSTDEHAALENLVRILKKGRILATDRTIKEGQKATCFMDVPFLALKYICSEANKGRYEPYGVFVTKSYAYKNKVRPVLYLSNKELSRLDIPEEEHWRVVRLEGTKYGPINWLHEREWRCAGDFELPDKGFGVLVKTAGEAYDLQERLFKRRKAFACVPLTVLPVGIVCQGLEH